MILITEMKAGNEIYYKETISDNDKIISSSDIKFHASTCLYNQRTYYLLYGPDMTPSEEVFGFLNFHMSAQSDNSKSKALYALKYLLSYEKIIGKELQDFNATDINGLRDFLRGRCYTGNLLSYECLTERSPETVNGYLSVYRSYLDYQGKANAYLSARTNKRTAFSTMNDGYLKFQDGYKSNEKTRPSQEEVPMYISLEDYWNIIQLVRNSDKYTIRDECIIRLMYEAGLRLGEVLGLTNEDICMQKVEEEYKAVIYIRNRVTDTNSQHAKTCMSVTDLRQYQSKDYRTVNYGFQTAFISDELYDLIGEYIEVEHEKQRELHKDNYFDAAIADCVMDESDENFYIFLNSLGRPLSRTSWGYIIRSIFAELGIPLDIGVREHNVSHRFRHGFAMFHIQHMNIRAKELAVLMRHTSINSVMKYYRPTTADKIKTKTNFANELYKMLPGLQQYREENA